MDALNRVISKASHDDIRKTLLDSLMLSLGSTVIAALGDPEVIEIMLNPDGSLWIERFGFPPEMVGTIEYEQAYLALTFIADALKTIISRKQPIVEGELPIDGSRFEGLVPPVVAAPTFAIRKKASRLFTLNDYLEAGNISLEALEMLEAAIADKKNILVAGGTGSGKTTFVNALVEAIDRLAPDDRLVVIEDTSELQVKSTNKVVLHSTIDIDMHALLKATMRLRPDRILVGEVRDIAVLALINAWNTGHEGGLATIHANSAADSLDRVEQIIMTANLTPVKKSLSNGINYVVFMKKDRGLRLVSEIVQVGYCEIKKDYIFDYKYVYEPADVNSGKIQAA